MLLLAFLLMPGLAWAQQGTIEGTVTDAETGESLPGATVQIPGQQVGAATGNDGTYSFQVEPGEYTVTVTFVGYRGAERTVEVQSGETTEVNFALQSGAVQLEEVAVTALGFEEDRDQLATAQSSVSGAEIEEAGQTSVLTALSAQATGLNVTKASGDPGAGARLLIRGQKTIQGSNQPLIVVDGIPVSNSNIGTGVGGVQQQSRLNDLNPNNIASVEVLKGASAAALWGSRAQNGVIVIETKRGTGGEMDVSFKTQVGVDILNKTVNLQERYGQGIYGQFAQGSGFSWGDRIAGREGGADDAVSGSDVVAIGEQTGTEYHPIPGGTASNPHGGKNSRETVDHSSEFFEPATRIENTLSVSGGGQASNYYLSIGHTRQNGIIPENSNYQRTNIRLNAERDVTDAFTVTGNAAFVRTASDRAQQGSNISGVMLGLLRTPPDVSNEDYTVNYFPNGTDGAALTGRQRSYQAPLGAPTPAAGSPGYDNPYWTINKNINTSIVNRFTGKVEGSYDPTNWSNITARVGVDTYSDRRQEYLPIYNATAPNGSELERNLGEYQVNADLIGRVTTDVTEEVGFSGLLGFNVTHDEYDNLQGSLTNFSNPVTVRSLGNAATTDVSAATGQSVERTASAYTELEFDLYEQLFLTATGRVDRSSTFGPDAQSTFFYPSLQAAWQFSDLLEENGVLSFGKLRASWGQVGRQPGPYQAFTYYSPGTYTSGYFDSSVLSASAYGGGYERNNSLGNPNIQPELTTSYEAGVDLRFFNDRLTFNGTYYFNRTEDIIFAVDVAPTSGYNTQTGNVASMENRGIELSLGADWVTSENFQWTTDLRWSRNENTVTSLSGVQEYGLAGFNSNTSSLVEGEEFGVFYGGRWRRASFAPLTEQEQQDGYTVAENGRVLDPQGFPVQASTQGVIGNPNPDWTAGISNTFNYKGLSLGFLVEASYGGEVWNGTKGALSYFGRHASQNWRTTISAEEATTLENYAGCTVEEMASGSCGGGGMTNNAVQNDDGSYTFRGMVKDFGGGEVIVDAPYYISGPGSGFTGPAEQFIEDGSFLRLRRVSLNYTWDSELVQQSGLSSVGFGVQANNLLLITPYSGIDPETNLTGPSNGQGIDYFNNPSTRTYQFTIRLNY